MTFRRKRPQATREERLALLMEAAQSTTYYGSRLIGTYHRFEEWLAALPVLRVEDVHRERARFQNRGSELTVSDFRYPIQPSPEVTALVRGFRAARGLRMPTRWDEFDLIATLQGGALAAPVHVLRSLAVPGRRLDYPLVAFTGPLHGLLSDEDRDLFWRCFGVPAFEQWLGLRNEVLAEECEAHDSLHIRTSEAHFELAGGELLATSLVNLEMPALRLAMGVTGRIVDGGCLCGKPGLRLTDLATLKAPSGAWCG